MILISNVGASQIVNRQFVRGVNFDVHKSDIIDTVLSKLRSYYENDTDGILKRVGKIHGINLKNKKKLEDFIINMEDDLSIILDIEDNWGALNISKDYGVSISQLLGKNLEFAGYGIANSGKNGDAYIDFVFKNEYLSSVSGSLATTVDYSIFSGFNYDNNELSAASANLRKNFGDYTFKQYVTTWNSCSTNPENVPMIEYTIKSDKRYNAILTFEYGIYQKKISKNVCRASGNHLTRINFYISKK